MKLSENTNVLNWQWDKPGVEVTIVCKAGTLLSVYRSIKHVLQRIAVTIVEGES